MRWTLKVSCLGLALALLAPTRAANALTFETIMRLARTAVSRTFYRGRVRQIQQALDHLAVLPRATTVWESHGEKGEPRMVIRKAITDVEAGLTQALARPWAWQVIEDKGAERLQQYAFTLLLRRVAKPDPSLSGRTSKAACEQLSDLDATREQLTELEATRERLNKLEATREQPTELAVFVREGQWKAHSSFRGGDGAYRTMWQWHIRVQHEGPSILSRIKDVQVPSIYGDQMPRGAEKHWWFVTRISPQGQPEGLPHVLTHSEYRRLETMAKRAVNVSDTAGDRDEDL